MWSAGMLQPQQHGRPSPWGEDTAWWRRREQQSPYTGAVDFRAAWPESQTRPSRR